MAADRPGRFARSPVRPFARSPVRRFARSPVRPLARSPARPLRQAVCLAQLQMLRQLERQRKTSEG